MSARQDAEGAAELSGRSAQDVRHAGGSYDPDSQMPSERIANTDQIEKVHSSGEDARERRGKKGKGGGKK